MSVVSGTQTLASAATALAAAEQVIEQIEAAPTAALPPAAALNAWLDTLRDTPIARDTAAWNRIYAAVQDIKAAIAAVKEN